MRRKDDLSDRTYGVVAGAKLASSGVLKAADLLGFSHMTISRLYTDLSKRFAVAGGKLILTRYT